MVSLDSNDTIVACATAPGRGAITIIRISGSDSINILSKVFRHQSNKNILELKSNTLNYGWLVNPESDEILDEVLVGIMKAPHTFTGEDVVEINCHGGIIIPNRIVELIIKNGARSAEPGEFTLRAVRSGRIDLSQAQAISALVDAQNETAARLALQQLRGGLSGIFNHLRDSLKEAYVLVETDIEFPLEEIDVDSVADLPPLIKKCLENIETIQSGLNRSRIIKDGILTLITGCPNVGKSSLFNRLARRNRVIVSEHPGTTRDSVEEIISLGGLPFKLVDTAGLGRPKDTIDDMGMERTREYFSSAELVLVVVDSSDKLTPDDKEVLSELMSFAGMKERIIILINKIDLHNPRNVFDEINKKYDLPVYKVSVLKGEGMAEFEESMISKVRDIWNEGQNADWISLSQRQVNALDEMATDLKEAEKILSEKTEIDKLAFHLTEAWNKMDMVDGQSLDINLLDEIFSRFCIGK